MTSEACQPVTWTETLRVAYEAPVTTNLPCADVVTAVCLALEKAIIEDPRVRDYLEALPKGKGTNCPDSPVAELAKMLAYRRGEVDQSDTRVWANFLEKFMIPIFAFRDELLSEALHAAPDMTVAEAFFFDAATFVSRATDRLWLAWLRRQSIPFRDLPEAQQAEFKRIWDGKLPVFDYTVFTHGLTELGDRVAWATAFPTEINEVMGYLHTMRDETTDEPLREYLKALIIAYGETDINQLEQRWADVDEAWIKIPADARFVPVHGMENYEHPYGVSPEFRLTMRVTDAVQAKEIAAFRAGSQHRLTQYGLAEDVQAAARAKLGSLDIGVFMAIAEGGVCLDFRLAGQVVPNRQDILARGGKVFIAESDAAYLKMLSTTLRKHCTPEAAEAVIALLSTFEQMRHTLGHECFHPVGCTPETGTLLGSAYNLLEEAKATIGGLITADDLDSSLLARQKSAASSIARVLRFMHKSRLEDASVAPYVRENLVIMSYLLHSGVIRQDAEGWVNVDLSADKLNEFFTCLRVFIERVIEAYQDGDITTLEYGRSLLCGLDDRGSDSDSAAIIRWVNRE